MTARTVLSSEFDWHATQNESYCSLRIMWNVSKAKRIIANKPREIVQVDVSDLRRFVCRTRNNASMLRHAIDWDVIDNGDVDITFPLIGITLPNSLGIVDGWHRIAKGFEFGIKEYSAAFLDAAETESITIDPFAMSASDRRVQTMN